MDRNITKLYKIDFLTFININNIYTLFALLISQPNFRQSATKQGIF